MPSSEPGPASSEAEALFDDYLARLEEGEEEDLPALLARHPEHADALLRLHVEWARLEAQLETALPGPLADGSLALDESGLGGPDARASSGSSGESDGTSGGEPPRVDVRPGQVLADYRLIRRIGQGGMGQVWEAEQLSLRRHVALKLVRPDRGGGSVVPRFGREARAGGRVDHAGIVSVYAAGEAGGVHYIAMQLVGGESLSETIARMRDEPRVSAADYRRVAALFADVADAVHAAHRAGILHRDLKPQNILIAPDGSPKVSDFGLAYLADEAARSARPGLVGTFPYMSPEQAAGKDVIIDGRSDVFSLGAVLYEVLTLRRAFEGDEGEQIVRRVLEHEPPDPRAIKSRVPSDLAVICMKALAKNRVHRYATMGDFADELRRFLRNEPIRARPPGVVARAVKWSVRHPAWSIGLFLGSLLLLVSAVLLLREFDLRRTAESERDRADQHALAADESARLAEDRAEQIRGEAYLSSVRAAAMHLARGHHVEARALLSQCAPDQRGWEWHHDALAADLSLLRLPSPEGEVLAVAVSPDGTLLAAGLPDGTLRVWDGASGAERARLAAHQGAVSALLFTSGGRLVSAGRDGTVILWDAADGARLAAFTELSPVNHLAADADATLLAAVVEQGDVLLLSPGDPDAPPRRFVLDPGLVSTVLSADGALLATASRYGTVSLWRTEDGSEVGPPRLPWYGGHTVVQLSADGRRLVTGAEDGRVTVWDVRAGDRVAELFGHASPVTALALSADGARLASLSGDDGTLLVWRGLDALEHAPDAEPDATEAQEVAKSEPEAEQEAEETPRDPPPDAPRIIVWDASTGRREARPAASVPRLDEDPGGWPRAVLHPTPILTGHDGRLRALAISADGSRVAAGSSDGRTLVWDGATQGARVTLPDAPAPITSLAVSADGSLAVTASLHEPVLRTWDLLRGLPAVVLAGHTLGATDLDVSADGARVVSTSYDGTLRVWDGRTGAPLLVQEASTRVGAVAIDGPGERVFTGASDGSITVLDAATGAPRAVLAGHRGPIVSLALDAAGDVLASASSDGALRVWDGTAGTGRWLRSGGAGGGLDDGLVAVSADGRRVAWASTTRSTVRVWNTHTGQPLSVLGGGVTGATALAFSPDGRRVVTASWRDPTLRVWNADTGRMLALLTGHGDTVTALATTADGARLLSTGQDGAFFVWESRVEQAAPLWRGVAR